MSFFGDIKDAKRRFPKYVALLRDLFTKYLVFSLPDFLKSLKMNPAFRHDFKEIAMSIFEADGGKVSIPLLCAVVGAALGGAGVAMLGGAFGVPLALVGALGGVFAGSEFDSAGITKRAMSFLRRKPL